MILRSNIRWKACFLFFRVRPEWEKYGFKKVLAKRTDLTYSISATTRPPRGQEVDGVDYYFLSKEQFWAECQNNGFLEWAEIYGHYYGTPKNRF